MFGSLADLNAAIKDSLKDWRYFSQQSWVAPKLTSRGAKVHDVLIVGAGQNGLALAYNLKLRGIRRIILVNAQDQDRPGPWSNFARMRSLRSPKSVPGPECFNPLLTFKAWYCAKYSRAEYDRFDTIPLEAWCQYLEWYRTVLGITTLSNTQVTDIGWDADESCLCITMECQGVGTVRHARKVCLATGMEGAGHWAPPPALSRKLPREAYFGAWEPISQEDLYGKDVAIVGAGASGFDNASFAVDSGCRSVTVFARQKFPERDIYFDLWCGRDDGSIFPEEAASTPADLLDALVAHYARIPDQDRVKIIANLFRHGRTPSNTKYLKEIRALEAMTVLEDYPVDDIDFSAVDNRVLIRSRCHSYAFDRVIFATGVQAGIEHRPELSSLSSKILTWGDCGDLELPPAYDLSRYPKLSRDYQLQPIGSDSEELRHIYCLADALHVTVGLQSSGYMARAVAEHIGASLYTDQAAEMADFIGREFTVQK